MKSKAILQVVGLMLAGALQAANAELPTCELEVFGSPFEGKGQVGYTVRLYRIEAGERELLTEESAVGSVDRPVTWKVGHEERYLKAWTARINEDGNVDDVAEEYATVKTGYTVAARTTRSVGSMSTELCFSARYIEPIVTGDQIIGAPRDMVVQATFQGDRFVAEQPVGETVYRWEFRVQPHHNGVAAR